MLGPNPPIGCRALRGRETPGEAPLPMVDSNRTISAISSVMSLLMSVLTWLLYVASDVVYDLYATECLRMLVSISWWDYGLYRLRPTPESVELRKGLAHDFGKNGK